jgi:uncharacterized protein (TIGR03437 family)
MGVKCSLALCVAAVVCQAQPVAIGAGYRLPRPIDVAPGQVITLFVRVPGKTAADPVTAQPPLPMALGGFSVVLRQSFPSDPTPAPIQAVADSQACSEVAPAQCDVLSMIAVQIPYELTPNVPRATMPANSARLEISYNGTTATTLLINPVTDRIHVLNSCDALSGYSDGQCLPFVSHSNGDLVDVEHPAQPGETLTVAMAGMGLLGQIVATGAAAPTPGPDVDNVLAGFDFGANRSTRLPTADWAAAPTAARLRSGAVGIYEVVFTVPAIPAGTPACGGDVKSNLTVSIGRTVSFDGVAICVSATPPPV